MLAIQVQDRKHSSNQTMSASNRAAISKTAFLQDAANSIAMDSPSTASYLASESIQLELANGPQNKALPDHQRQTSCTACGNVFIPGWNCSIVRGDRGAAPYQSKNFQRCTIVYHCQACYHRSTFCLPSPKRVNANTREKDARRSTILDLDTKHQSSPNSIAAPTKTSSKKRAKSRKEKAGLQSLLGKSKEEARTSPQLNLMDLMMP